MSVSVSRKENSLSSFIQQSEIEGTVHAIITLYLLHLYEAFLSREVYVVLPLHSLVPK